MMLLKEPDFSAALTEFLLDPSHRHQICYNLCKTAVLESNLGCLEQPLGKIIKSYKPRVCYFNRTFHITAKICRSTICFNVIFVCSFAFPSLNVLLTCESAVGMWICNLRTTCNLFFFFPFALQEGAIRQIKQETHTRRQLQYGTQGFFVVVVHIPLMTFTQTNPCCYSSKINL